MNYLALPCSDARYDYSPAIANKILDIFDFAIQTRARSLFIRFDLKFPDDGFAYDKAEIFRSFMRTFIQDRTRQGFGDLYYVAVRARNRSKHGQYHVFILLNGKNTQSLNGHMEKAKDLWTKSFSDESSRAGLFSCRSHDENNGLMIHRDAPDFVATVTECIKQALYLATVETKDWLSKHGRTWSSTTNIPRGRRDAFFVPDFPKASLSDLESPSLET